MRKVITIFRDFQKKSENYNNAESLAKSWGDIFVDFEISTGISKSTHLQNNQITIENCRSELIATLDSIKLGEELLILPLFLKDEVANYIAENENKDSRLFDWHVVYNNFTRHTFLTSSSDLSNNIPRDTLSWINQLIAKYSKNTILNSLNSLPLKMHLLGETIIDEYIYCEPLGKVSKDPLIAFRISEITQQLGGIIAAANHVVNLTGSCVLFTEAESEILEKINFKLSRGIDTNFISQGNASQVIKTRYVDVATNARVFETYSMNSSVGDENKLKEIVEQYLENNLIKELIIIDFGHGLINASMIRILMNKGIKISVNAQSNAGNRGLNSISRYSGAERIFINGSELELEARRVAKDRKDLVLEIAPKLNCKEMYVTQGAAGLLYWNKIEGIVSVPGFAPSIIDRVGAGDALLTTIACLRANGVPSDISSFFGNISGGMALGSIGNSFSISKSLLESNAQLILEKVSSQK